MYKIRKKKYISDNLSFLLEQYNIDIKNLSAQTGIPPTTISRIKQRNSNPTITSLEPLAQFFRVNIDTLLYEDMRSNLYKKKKLAGNIAHIPVLELDDIKNFPSNNKVHLFVGAAGVNPESTFGVSITNTNLEPYFKKNSILLVDTDLKPNESDIVLCFLDNNFETPVFRQVFFSGSEYLFKKLLNSPFEQYDNYKIVGVIIKSIENFR